MSDNYVSYSISVKLQYSIVDLWLLGNSIFWWDIQLKIQSSASAHKGETPIVILSIILQLTTTYFGVYVYIPLSSNQILDTLLHKSMT